MFLNKHIKQWSEKTPLNLFFKESFLSSTINYEDLEYVNENPSLIKKAITRNVEFLWYTNGSLKIIYSTLNHCIISIEIDSEILIMNVFNTNLIKNLDNYENKNLRLVIKTRVPVNSNMPLIHELRYFKEI